MLDFLPRIRNMERPPRTTMYRTPQDRFVTVPSAVSTEEEEGEGEEKEKEGGLGGGGGERGNRVKRQPDGNHCANGT